MIGTIYKVIDGRGVKLHEATAEFRDKTVRIVNGRTAPWGCRIVVPIEEVDTTPKAAIDRFVKEQRAEIDRLRKEADRLEYLVALAVTMPREAS